MDPFHLWQDDFIIFNYALKFVGIPYIYGGNNPVSGFDCSGLVCELLRAKGVIGREDMSAQGLYHKFKDSLNCIYPQAGCLVFYGKSKEEISHVSYCLSAGKIIEAGGGDHTTKSVADAAAKNACVRIRPIGHRSDVVAIIQPSA